MTQLRSWAYVLCLSLVLSACGWQLRGAPVLLDLGSISLAGGSFDIQDLLTEALQNSDIDVREDDADFQLRLSNERFDRRTVAVDAQGRAAETELNYNINWALLDDKGNLLSEGHRVNLIRNINYDPTNTTASSDEERAIRDSMYEDAAWQILRQLNATSTQLFMDEIDDDDHIDSSANASTSS